MLLFYNLDKNIQDNIYYFYLGLKYHDVKVNGVLIEGRITAMLLFLILINEA
jgi:hypothetical protein